MPTPALLAVAALAGAATLSSRARTGSFARKTPAQAAAHKARLVELLRAGRWWDALELNEAKGKERLDLGGADLTGTSLYGADLSGADLSGAWLIHAKLINTNLTNANLSGANLFGANLTGDNLTGANLTDAVLAYARLLESDLRDANLTGANLTGADLDKARLPEGFLSPNTRLDAVPWTGTPFGWRAIASPRGARLLPITQA